MKLLFYVQRHWNNLDTHVGATLNGDTVIPRKWCDWQTGHLGACVSPSVCYSVIIYYICLFVFYIFLARLLSDDIISSLYGTVTFLRSKQKCQKQSLYLKSKRFDSDGYFLKALNENSFTGTKTVICRFFGFLVFFGFFGIFWMILGFLQLLPQ